MTIQIVFDIPHEPVPKGRPRFARRGGFVQTYTDAKTLTYENIVRTYAKKAMGSSKPLEGAISVYLYIRMSVPKNYSKARRKACIEGVEKPTKKPDLDNVAKSISDGMNGIVYVDDGQIVDLHVKKVYSSVAGVDVLVREE